MVWFGVYCEGCKVVGLCWVFCLCGLGWVGMLIGRRKVLKVLWFLVWEDRIICGLV